uniref:Uncharacterized protein n=1 Tax=Arundo donax TaxID=35708 RepID=A0A0A9B0H8_ARUDO
MLLCPGGRCTPPPLQPPCVLPHPASRPVITVTTEETMPYHLLPVYSSSTTASPRRP